MDLIETYTKTLKKKNDGYGYGYIAVKFNIILSHFICLCQLYNFFCCPLGWWGVGLVLSWGFWGTALLSHFVGQAFFPRNIIKVAKLMEGRCYDTDQFTAKSGSASVILSRKFVEYCILGTDNLPRTLLMYYGNTPSSQTNYFQTVLCNSPYFNRTVVNHDLHYVIWDIPSKKEPRVLTTNDLENMTQSGAAFGTRFARDDPVLDHIDQEVLNRGPGKIVPGGWCLGKGHGDACMFWGNADVLSPGPRAARLADFISQLLSAETLRSHQCIWD